MKTPLSFFSIGIVLFLFCFQPLFASSLLPTTIQNASAEGKLTMVVFGSDVCPPCELLKDQIETNQNIKQELDDAYQVVYLDHKRDKQWFKSYNVKMMPTTIIINTNRKVVARADYYLKQNEFLSFLKQPQTAFNMVKVQTAPKPNPTQPQQISNQELKKSFAQLSVVNQTVQVFEIRLGSFSTLSSAKKYASEVSNKHDMTAYVSQPKSSDLFIVSIGRSESKNDLTSTLKAVKQQFLIADAYIASTQMNVTVPLETVVIR